MVWRERFRKEVDEIDAPKSEINDVIDKGINRGRKDRVSKRKSKYKVPAAILSAAVILFVTTVITLSFSNPSFAERIPIIGNIYELFKEDNKEYIFEEYSSNSTDIAETVESSGVNITITDATYDTESITVAYTMESEESLGEEPFLDGRFEVEEYKRGYTPGRFMTEKISENEYAGIFVLYLMQGKSVDQVNITWDGKRIRRSFDEEEPIEGDWSFEFTLDALEAESTLFDGLSLDEQGMEVKVTKMTSTPVANTFNISQRIDENLKEWEEEGWEVVSIDYLVSDNLGNEYNVLHNAGYGDNMYVTRQRFTTSIFNEGATSIIITPMVNIYNDEFELVKDPYKLGEIEVPLDEMQ